MNNLSFKKTEIYNKLSGLNEHELSAIANFIDSIKHKKKHDTKKIIKLEGILKGYDIGLSDLKTMKDATWRHVDEEAFNG